jgi:hypothetical protein
MIAFLIINLFLVVIGLANRQQRMGLELRQPNTGF